MDKKMISTNRKVVTFGEVMLRLTAPDFRRFSQTNEFIATYGGSEANVAVSLANFGIPTEFVTRLPDNAMAQACIASLRANGLPSACHGCRPSARIRGTAAPVAERRLPRLTFSWPLLRRPWR